MGLEEQDHDRTEPSDATILLVDDEQSVLETYELYLESDGYEVLTATNGGEALVKLEPGVDVVLLDRRMPGMTGDEVLEHIRDWDHNCRVAMITAVDPDSDIVEMEFDDYLTKPIEKDELVETVEQFLLFDEYERLLTEYVSVTKTYATLKSNLEAGPTTNDTLAELDDRRERLRAEIDEVIESFTDEDIADVFRQVHASR